MRKLMWFTIGFGIACAFCAYCYGAWLLYGAILAGEAAILLLLLTRRYRHLRVPTVMMLGLAAGLAMFLIYDNVKLSDARELDGKTEHVTFIVRDYSYETNYGSAFDGTIEINGQTYNVRVYLDEKLALEPGNRVLGDFNFQQTTGGGVDEVLYHRGQGIFLLAGQRGNITVERCWSVPWRDLPAVWRQELKQIIDDSFPADAAAFAKGLLLGDRTDIDYETDTAFKVSGISHIIAVSGLHVSILFGLVYVLSGRRRLLTTLIGVPIVLLFAAVAGFTPSITRAAIMQCVMMAAQLLRREYDPPTSLSFAALVMLFWNPLVITSVSFQLSFGCMAGIFLFSEPINGWLLDEKRLGKWDNALVRGFCGSVAVSLSASVFTTPLSALYFGTVSLIGPLTNLLTLWVITFVFYGVMAVCVLGWLGVAAAGLAGLVAWPIRYVLTVARALAEFPLAAVYTRSDYVVAWLVFVYVLLAIYLTLKEKPALPFAAGAVLTLCLAVGLSWAEPWVGEYRMTVLDVGQGQAILLQNEGKTFLVDCGGDYDEDAADITAETLLSQGISRLDGIILTHYDRDHSGGLPYLLTRIDTELLLMPYCLDENGVGEELAQLVGDRAQVVMEDTVLSYDGTELSVFAPVSYNSGNESSMCVLFRAENCDILITGDMGEAGERLLLKYHDLPQVDALVVGHHGSKYSTGEELLAAVQPRYAFISVSEDNSYGHPAQEVLDRLAQLGCVVCRTDEDGTIIFRG